MKERERESENRENRIYYSIAVVIELKKTNVSFKFQKNNSLSQTSQIFVSKIHMGAVYR